MIKISLINNLYVFVENEDISYSGESTSHPVEKGIEISDHYKRSPVELSLSGKIVDNKKTKAKDILDKLKKLQNEGSLIKYVGRNSLGNMQIQSISVSSPNTNWGGYDVDISLKEIRIAKQSYDAAKSKLLSSQQVKQGENEWVYHKVVKGNTIWGLVTGPYKDLKPSYSKVMDKCNYIMSINQDAFSRKGDFRTLKIGYKLKIGKR